MVNQLDAATSHLISDFHHDFLTVLTNLMVFVDFTLSKAIGPLTEKQEESLRIIQRNAHRLQLMADNLASAARRADDADSIPFAAVDLLQLATDAEDLFSLFAQDSEVSLEVVAKGENFLINGSEIHLVSLFNNLVSNAIKYTPDGGHVIMRLTGNAETVLLEVVDSGQGIAPEDLPRIFQAGFRAQVGRAGKRKGLGLGLGICEEVARMHKTNLQVESEMGKGSCFHIEFPR